MYDANGGLGGLAERGPRIDNRDQLPLQPNQFYQEKVIQYLAGWNGVFKDNTLQGNLVDSTARNELLKGIAAGRYDAAIQMMLAQEMQPMKGITAEQMRKVCTDQVELLRREGHERIKNDRFIDAANDIHRIMQPLASAPAMNAGSTPTRINGSPIQPLDAATKNSIGNPREQTIDPELATKISLKEFLQAQKTILTAKLNTTPENELQSRFQANARINLIDRSLTRINNGTAFAPADVPLLTYLINETKDSESARLAKAQAFKNTGNEREIATIASSVQKLWQMQQYVELHQEKPNN